VSLDFVARLERPALRFLKEHLDADFCVQEVGDDEAITFLHNQLLVQRDRQIEARGFRRGILIGLAASGVVLAAGIGLFVILNLPVEHMRSAPESAGERRPISEERSVLQPPKKGVKNSEPVQAAPKAETGSPSATTSTSPVSSTAMEGPGTVVAHPPVDVRSSQSAGEGRSISEEGSAITPPPPVSSAVVEGPATVVAHPPANLHYSDAEITAFMRRGDEFLTLGDITSARLFYERAADAGSGRAALQLGATFDPVILGYVGARSGLADPAQALSWYRRARELGMVEAEQRIRRFETSIGPQGN
jgi:hypothetical protein